MPDVPVDVLLEDELLGAELVGAGPLELGAGLDEEEVPGEGAVVDGALELPAGLGLPVGECLCAVLAPAPGCWCSRDGG